jgi:phenazine biosynthesis protein phzE
MDTLFQKLSAGDTAFCLIQKQDDEEVLVLSGQAHQFTRIKDIPRRYGATGTRCYDSISVIPFCQIKEKGYDCHDDGETIRTLTVDDQYQLPVHDLIAAIDDQPLVMENGFQHEVTEEQYAEIIREIIGQEIGNGEGANFVVPRNGCGRIKNFSVGQGLSLFKFLLQHDFGTYWKFLFYDRSLCFIGSTPERHLLVEDGCVTMNPISGTFRKDPARTEHGEFKQDLLAFINDPKEINELFMVVDEELKMMSRMCSQGGSIVGPLLKEMSRLIHSEYLLSGTSDKDIFELFTDSMFAATVVGSPVRNACRIIKKYSKTSRRYYGSAMMLVGRDEKGRDFLDSPITIRTLEIAADGVLHMSVGATLVKDSVPTEEVAETKAKAAAVLAAILGGAPPAGAHLLTTVAYDDEIAQSLAQRNRYLSDFWFFRQQHALPGSENGDKIRISLIDNEDDFIHMLSHIFTALGMQSTLIPYQEYVFEKDTADITLVGPGPGNPNDESSEKIRKNMRITRLLLENRRPALFICLGHQFLCRALGLTVARKQSPFQGSQIRIDLFGRPEWVGFYNTFVPLSGPAAEDFETSVIPELKEVVAIRGEHFAGFQFHPESILTRNGIPILREAIQHLLAAGVLRK